jgi:hypothetical protein
MALPKPIMNLPGAAFLNKFWLDQQLREKMNPLLYFNGILPVTDSTEKQFLYEVIENTATVDLEDGVMSLPLPSGEEAALSRLEMSNISQVKGRIPKVGYMIPLSRDLLSKSTIQNEMEMRIGKAAFGMSYYMNSLIIDTLVAGATSGTVSISPTWGSATGSQDPIKDLINMWYDFKEKEYPNRMNDIFCETVTHQEAIQYLSSMDIDFTLQDERTISVDTYPGLRGLKIHDVEDQLPHGTAIELDGNPSVYPGAEIYRYIDNDFAVRVANPDNGGVADPTGVHVNVWTETKNPFTTFVELWMHPLPVVKIAKMIKAQTGL